MDHALTAVIASYGLLAIFLLMVAEGAGLPFPSEVILPAGGVLASIGHINLGAAIGVGIAGNVVGALIAYAVAARWGRRVLLGPGHWVGVSSRHLDLAERWFTRFGWLAVLVCRLLPVARSYVSFPAGLARMRVARFTGLTLLGSAPWCAALGVVGYELGAHYTRVSQPIQLAAIVCAILLVAVLAAWFLLGRRSLARDSERADAAMRSVARDELDEAGR